ncbi:MAG: response regulator [Sulfitobacter sp.]
MITGHHILIVEDDALQAMDLKFALGDAGFTVIGPAKTPLSAFSMIDETPPDCAILDYNLAHETSVDVAIHLHSEGVPFVYVTGEIEKLLADKTAPKAEVFQKPYIQTELIKFIARRLNHG